MTIQIDLMLKKQKLIAEAAKSILDVTKELDEDTLLFVLDHVKSLISSTKFERMMANYESQPRESTSEL